MNEEQITPIDPATPLYEHINQNGVQPGIHRLKQFKLAMALRGTPPLYTQEEVNDPMVYVKFFSPAGSATWYVTEYDPEEDRAFGYATGMTWDEWGYFTLEELAYTMGIFGIGIELDTHFLPQPMSAALKN